MSTVVYQHEAKMIAMSRALLHACDPGVYSHKAGDCEVQLWGPGCGMRRVSAQMRRGALSRPRHIWQW